MKNSRLKSIIANFKKQLSRNKGDRLSISREDALYLIDEINSILSVMNSLSSVMLYFNGQQTTQEIKGTINTDSDSNEDEELTEEEIEHLELLRGLNRD